MLLDEGIELAQDDDRRTLQEFLQSREWKLIRAGLERKLEQATDRLKTSNPQTGDQALKRFAEETTEIRLLETMLKEPVDFFLGG